MKFLHALTAAKAAIANGGWKRVRGNWLIADRQERRTSLRRPQSAAEEAEWGRCLIVRVRSEICGAVGRVSWYSPPKKVDEASILPFWIGRDQIGWAPLFGLHFVSLIFEYFLYGVGFAYVMIRLPKVHLVAVENAAGLAGIRHRARSDLRASWATKGKEISRADG